MICTKGGENGEGLYDVNDVRWTHGAGSSSLTAWECTYIRSLHNVTLCNIVRGYPVEDDDIK